MSYLPDSSATGRSVPTSPLRTPLVVHRLRGDGWAGRHAVCGAIEHKRNGERLNFTIDPDDVTCGGCSPIDTGAVCPGRFGARWWKRPHVGEWRSLDMGNCQTGPCRFCGRSVQQRLSYGGKPLGPWIDDVSMPCAHGVGGVPTPACMRCANERAARGLFR